MEAAVAHTVRSCRAVRCLWSCRQCRQRAALQERTLCATADFKPPRRDILTTAAFAAKHR
jgi:hypothetical protein